MGCGGSTNSGVESQSPHHYDQSTTTNAKSNSYYSDGKRGVGRNNINNYNNNINNNNIKSIPTKENGRSPRRVRPYPESKYTYAASNGSASTDFGDAKGYKRRIRTQLQDATARTSVEELESAIAVFEKNRMEDGGDLTRAYDRLDYLKMKRDLRDAIRRSNVGVLEQTIAEARASPYAPHLVTQIDAAERKLAHLKELNSYSHDILDMDQSTISELHSYHRPPACVKDVMAASYMLLGYKESQLRDWTYVQGQIGRVGRDSLIHQVRHFDTTQVNQHTTNRVREILGYHDLDEVRGCSNGAATFHLWATNVVDMIDRDKSEEEARRRMEEEQPPPPPPPANVPASKRGKR